ncbi:BRO family protein [Bifidobacterium sp. ESL0775]|uniref:BRO family protein n=1 Tax=Bifidobacterium sp. ESL0775 TaxID=2983230 RepID=UPI0023F75103|nr:BRO family protein [Bifidobacterium sp. ESL0775]WEV68745.1 BRO family protein [Bifidobacterium sp. ESL0775]
MNNDIQTFNFEGNQVRTFVGQNGETWWLAKDVTDILGTATRDLRKILDIDEMAVLINVDTIHIDQNGGKSPLIISEPGLYKLILKSRKPQAKAFQRWVTHEVLPQIRKTGGYTAPSPVPDDDLSLISRGLLAAQRQLGLKDEEIMTLRHNNETQRETIEAQKPMARLGELFLGTDGTLTVTQAARHLRTLDRTMTRDMVFGLLRGAGYLEQRSNAPTMKAVKPGYLKQKCGRKNDGSLGHPYAVFTPKGLNWFIDRFVIPQQQGQLPFNTIQAA